MAVTQRVFSPLSPLAVPLLLLPRTARLLSGVKYHNGRAYYSQMAWYTPGYRTFGSHGSTLVLHFGILPGATVPGWH